MQFKVPQFIDIEDKIFGPFTFRQFIFLIGGGGMAYVVYKIIPLWIGIFIILPIAALTICLDFVKINNKPFLYYLEAAFNYLVSSKLYIWKQILVKKDSEQEDSLSTPTKVSKVPMISENRLKDLSWSLDVQDRNNQ